MKPLLTLLLPLSLCAGIALAAEAEYKVETFKGNPEGVSEKIAPLLNESGYKVTGPDGLVAEIWFLKEIEAKPEFKPGLFVKYPFTVGQLVGAIRIPEGKLDFRGQELPGGTFTLRYGQMPQDGNHLGKSDTLDFFLACSLKADTDPAPVKGTFGLHEMSAKAAGSSHPAIFLLDAPGTKEFKQPGMTHNDDHDYWIMQTNVNVKQGDKTHALPLQIVVAGISPEA